LTDFLPTTRKELELRGWNEVDVVLFTGDAYVDHPSFGAAVVGRLLEAKGLRVAIVPQPDWRGDHRDFTKMGRPRLFFAVTGGNMDSMVNHYTAGKRLRSDDAFTPEGRSGARPDYATVTYSRILRTLYPDAPIVLGGIEASMRRLTHYDYWSDTLKPCLLEEAQADLLVYGMGELPLLEMCQRLESASVGETPWKSEAFRTCLKGLSQTAQRLNPADTLPQEGVIRLHAHEECLLSKRKQAENVRRIEEESNAWSAATLVQRVGDTDLVVYPPFPTLTTEQLDQTYEYPYTRLPHPKYKDKVIPAYEMIKFSVNIHRGCFGGCSFCTISAHQGKFIVNRSKESILKEVKTLIDRPDFKGYLSDLGGPSANMYRLSGKDTSICRQCKRASCIHPGVCKNLNTDHGPLLDIYRAVDALPGIKKSFIGSGIRYDLLTAPNVPHAREYLMEVIENHVSGRLKVAPEHTSEAVLQLMRKPSFEQFKAFNRMFESMEEARLQRTAKHADRKSGRQQLIPYFISAHPGCTERDMAQLAQETRKLHFKLEQVQDFTPTPMTLSSEMYYTGLNPYTLKPVFTAKTRTEKEKQRSYFFWYQKK
jgi:uncharacterized radical SAM protein YgiQ